MRGSKHDKDIRECTIDGKGLHIGKAFRTVTGIVNGQPIYMDFSDIERLETSFRDGDSDGLKGI